MTDKELLKFHEFKKELNSKWNKSDDLPEVFGTKMLVVDWIRTKPHITLETYDKELQEWFEQHPTAMWCCVYELLPNFENDF